MDSSILIENQINQQKNKTNLFHLCFLYSINDETKILNKKKFFFFFDTLKLKVG